MVKRNRGKGPGSPKQDLGLSPPALPEGGFQAWAAVAGTYSTSFGVYQGSYTPQIDEKHVIDLQRRFLHAELSCTIIVLGYFVSYSFSPGPRMLPAKIGFQISPAQGLGAGIGTGAVYVWRKSEGGSVCAPCAVGAGDLQALH
ncbi:hypothetical protein DFH09DRAFT_1098046 [Mycena vulgaris]|nr:hypothetical protein DFH09DRAFT_1098046 [Mycena vulgaris]